MRYDVAFTGDAHSDASEHLLQYLNRGVRQEDLCFALWRPSTGRQRTTALISEIMLPLRGERQLHGNASFNPQYLSRAIIRANETGMGLAFMHSHLGPGWQGLSVADALAERNFLVPPASALNLPLVGLTIGNDGTWSGRVWMKHNKGISGRWCDKVRIIQHNSYEVYFNDRAMPVPSRRKELERTYQTLGTKAQNDLSRLHVGIVGLGSIGSIVAEALARLGIEQITLIDPDKVERHNLDRLLGSGVDDIGKLKVNISKENIEESTTAAHVTVLAIPKSLEDAEALRAALDCDLIFSCVDRYVARDILNFVAIAHLIPVCDGGIDVAPTRQNDGILSAHWRAHMVTPYHQCLRCNDQYDTSLVRMEREGSLDDPSYVRNLPPESRDFGQNIFPFALSAASAEIEQFLRYTLNPGWWPSIHQIDHQFTIGESKSRKGVCHDSCEFRSRIALGDTALPSYLDER